MAKLANRVSTFRIAFHDERVKKYDTQLSAPIDYVPKDEVDELEIIEDDRTPTSILQKVIHDDKDLETKSKRSTGSRGSTPTITPSKRNGRGPDSARAWLLGWLVVAEMFYCHITHLKPHFHLAVQIAYILVPQADRENDLLILLYEFLLGMPSRSLCIHSRLFLIPLQDTVHAALDANVFIILPCLEILEKMSRYLRDVYNAREDNVEDSAWWHKLRDGTLQGGSFSDGHIYQYHVVAHAGTADDVRLILSPFGNSEFFSHLSPFAALLNAFRTLYAWTQPHKSHAYPVESDPTLHAALQEAQVPNPQQVLRVMRRIHHTLMGSLREFKTAIQVTQAWRPKRGGGGADDTLRKYGFDGGLRFGGPNDGTGGGDAGGAEGPSSSSASDSPKEPQDGDILFGVPDESVDSIWSNDDSGEGTLAVEPVSHDFTSGPSPSQRIVDDWRSANPLILTPPLSISPVSSPSTSSSPFSVPSQKSSHGKENVVTTPLFSPKKHMVLQAHLPFRKTKAGAQRVAVQIFGNSNA